MVGCGALQVFVYGFDGVRVDLVVGGEKGDVFEVGVGFLNLH